MKQYKYTQISYRNVRFYYEEDGYCTIKELPYSERKHIETCISSGSFEGELNYFDIIKKILIKGYWEII